MQLSPKEILGFREWLDANTELQEKSKRDVVSRLKRSPLEIAETTSDSHISGKVNEAAEDLGLSVFVTSQIKRAMRLYRDYLKHSRSN